MKTMIKNSLNIAENILLDRETGVFDKFYLPYLSEFEARLADELEAFTDSIEIDIPSVVEGAVYSQRDSLIAMSTRSLLLEMYEMKKAGKLEGDDKYQQYKAYNELTGTEEFHSCFSEKYPLLEELLRKKNETKLSLLCECMENLIGDAEEIKRELGVEPGKVVKLISDGGDTHNNGKSVVTVELDDDTKLFYKPHSLDGDAFFRDFVREFSGDNRLADKVARFVSCKGHGWQECVKHREASDKNEVLEYYRLIGIYIALFYVIGTEDMHYENMIACGDAPKFIDMETALANQNSEWYGNTESLIYTLLDRLKKSVFSSIILPQNYEYSMFDIDLSALTGGMKPKKSDKISHYVLAEPFTSDLRYEKKFSNIEQGSNLQKLEGEIVNPGEYTDVIIESFTESYRNILNNKNDIAVWLERKAKEKQIFRQVLRATYMYAKFQDASYHPKYLSEFSERNRMFSIMYGKKEITETKRRIVDAEKSVMLNNDIPYFFTYIDSHDVYCPCGEKTVKIENVYGQTIIEKIVSRLDEMSESDLRIQKNFIRAALANCSGHTVDKLSEQNHYLAENLPETVDVLRGKERYLKIAEDIALAIESKKIVCEKDKNAALLELNINDENNQMLGSFKPDLYNGLGCLMFIGLTAYKTGNEKLRNFMYELDRGFESIFPTDIMLNNPQFSKLSVFSGAGSYLYVYTVLSRFYGDSVFREKADKALEVILSTEPENENNFDIIDGFAGLLPVLCEIADDKNDGRIWDYIIRAAKRLSEIALGGNVKLAGYAHGYAGIISSLSEVYRFTGDKKIAETVNKLIAKENEFFSSEHGNWRDARSKEESYEMSYWCHGNSGISLARKNTAENFINVPEIYYQCRKDASAGIEEILKTEEMYNKNHCICHGFMGNIEILNSLRGFALGADSRIDSFIEENMKCFLSQVCEKGFRYQYESNIESFSFMTGLSGIGYAFLRLADGSLPDALLLKTK